jgi:Family of unknown function (DUF6279)
MLTRSASGASRPLYRAAGLLRGALIAVTATVALAACSVGFVYDRLDLLIAWYVSGYVTLDDEQEARLRSAVRDTLAWQRDTQVPRYVSWLEDLARDADSPQSVEEISRRYDQAVVMADDFLAYVTPATAEVFRGLSARQIAELRKSLAEENDELWAEYAGDSPGERRARRQASAEKSIRRFVGRLTPAQRDLVAAELAGLDDLSDQWMNRRRFWQEQFVALLESPPPGDAFGAALRNLALQPNQFDDGAYRLRVEHNRGIILAMVAAVSASLSDEQRRHLKRKFGEYAADLRKLASSG